MHYYKRNLGDYAKKAGRLTMLQHGAYTLLIDSCYDREVFPTLEQAIEWTWASTEAEIDAVKFVLSRFFTITKDGEYVQDRILQELLEYHAKADRNKEIAIEREAKRKEGSTNRTRTVDEPSPNHKPITTNHKPVTKYIPPIPTELFTEYQAIRKSKRAAPLTERMFNAICKQAALAGITPDKAITICCERGWTGFEASWLKQDKQASTLNAALSVFKPQYIAEQTAHIKLVGDNNADF
jgi:uncharacterized protein YdaU (DUF1376 family)